MFFKDDPVLAHTALALAQPSGVDASWPLGRRRVVDAFNRFGGLVTPLAERIGVERAAVLGVWMVESAGRPHVAGQAIIRFENHLFYRGWGAAHDELYGAHFRHGGYRGESGRPWERHRFRARTTGPLRRVHDGSQQTEYAALRIAQDLAGESASLRSISIGGPQILVSNFRMLGYASAAAMAGAFQQSERAHVLGFFDFCQHAPGDLLAHLRALEWTAFAHGYNGAGNVATYGPRLRDQHVAARRALDDT